MSGLELTGLLIDLFSFLYWLPFAVAGIIWLLVSTEFTIVRQQWPMLSLVLVVGWLFKQLAFTLRLEVRPGIYSLAGGSFEKIVFWSAALLFGPSALWTMVLLAIINLEWQRRTGRYSRWYQWREFTFSLFEASPVGLVALSAYEALGGVISFPGVQATTIGPIIVATMVWFLLPRLFSLPLLIYASRSPELVGAGSLTDQPTMTRFLLIGNSVSGIADPFAVLAAALYARQGIGIFLSFIAGTLLAALLANRLSSTASRSEQRSRELTILERMSRAIMTAPANIDMLSDILAAHVTGMFPHSRMEIRLFPENVLFTQFQDGQAVEPSIWEQLRQARTIFPLQLSETSPTGQPNSAWQGLAVTIEGSEDDEPLGGVCLFSDRTVGQVSDYMPAAQSLAAQIASAMQRIELQEQVLEEQAEVYQREVYAQAYQAEALAQALSLERMTQELAVAGRIQASFLPRDVPDLAGWQISVALEPAREASGDFYDIIELPNGLIGLVVADVADKGVGAALYMALSRTLIRTYSAEHQGNPERVLAAANRRILADTNSELFVTVFYAVLDTKTGQLSYCNAGHNPPFLLQSENGNATRSLTRTALPLGILETANWGRATIQMMPGDILMLYTDGVTEAQDEEETFFGEDRLQKLLRVNANRSADVIEDKVFAAIYDFAGDVPQYDDITLMVVVREHPEM